MAKYQFHLSEGCVYYNALLETRHFILRLQNTNFHNN